MTTPQAEQIRTPSAPEGEPIAHRFQLRVPTGLMDEVRNHADFLDWSVNSFFVEAARRLVARGEKDRARLDRPDGPDVVELTTQRPADDRQRLIVNGWPVPYISVYQLTPDRADGERKYKIILDRPGAGASETDLLTWGEVWTQAWFLAEAMAVASGYTTHGPNAKRINPHGPASPADLDITWDGHGSTAVDQGWAVMDEAGSSGRGYEVTVRFTLPNMEWGDQVAHEVRDTLLSATTEAGGREVHTMITALTALEEDRRQETAAKPRPVIDYEEMAKD